MHRGVGVLHKKCGVAYTVVTTTADDNALLNTEIAGLQPLGGKPLGVHVYIADGSLQLTVASHRADKRHLGKHRP